MTVPACRELSQTLKTKRRTEPGLTELLFPGRRQTVNQEVRRYREVTRATMRRPGGALETGSHERSDGLRMVLTLKVNFCMNVDFYCLSCL